jgi:hypothetical protein
MIAHLRGKLLAKHPNQVVVETSGVGYEVNISVPTFSELPTNGAEVALHIHTHVREDVIALYGFLRPAEKQLFEKLMTVSGIGAKLAITILSGMAADEMTAGGRDLDINHAGDECDGRRCPIRAAQPGLPEGCSREGASECGEEWRGQWSSVRCRISGCAGRALEVGSRIRRAMFPAAESSSLGFAYQLPTKRR